MAKRGPGRPPIRKGTPDANEEADALALLADVRWILFALPTFAHEIKQADDSISRLTARGESVAHVERDRAWRVRMRDEWIHRLALERHRDLGKALRAFRASYRSDAYVWPEPAHRLAKGKKGRRWATDKAMWEAFRQYERLLTMADPHAELAREAEQARLKQLPARHIVIATSWICEAIAIRFRDGDADDDWQTAAVDVVRAALAKIPRTGKPRRNAIRMIATVVGVSEEIVHRAIKASEARASQEPATLVW